MFISPVIGDLLFDGYRKAGARLYRLNGWCDKETKKNEGQH